MEQHLSQDLILRGIDGELTVTEHADCVRHLAFCDPCRRKSEGLREFSLELEALVQAAPIPESIGMRDRIQRSIEASQSTAILQNPAAVMRRFGWAMGIAALLAIAVLLAPKPETTSAFDPVTPRAANTIEVDGESFFVLPYSNADLTTATPHIVQMQVPVSSLAEAGIFIEPVSKRLEAEVDSRVLANVLVGADGQARGIHVLSAD